MRKLYFLFACLSLTLSSTSIAQGNHGPSGCGLGSEVIFREADEWHEHVLSALTNFSASNTFAMTSGTLGCEDANGPLKPVLGFIDSNIDQLAHEAAIGEGEALDALGELLGIEQEDHSAFKSALKSNFGNIFKSVETSASDILQDILITLKNDGRLYRYLG